MTNITPRVSYSPLGRQPFRPGQWQGYKGMSNNTTYIQNNFFGSGYNSGMNYGNYNNCYSYDNGPSKFAKWMMGIGVGSALLGGILKMFGVGNKEEAGAIETTKPTEATPAPTAPKPTEAEPVETPAPTAAEPTGAAPTPAPTAPDINWNDVDNMICTDASDKTSPISGKLTLGDNGNPPQSFTITDISSGKANVYKYELQEAKEGEKPIYKCVSRNGQPATSENAYTLENENGTPKLVQYKGQGNYGEGLKFGSLSIKTTPTITATTETTAPPETTETTETPNTDEADKEAGKKAGITVADDLVGYTTTAEKERVISTINELKPNNVAEFLSEYNKNKGLGNNLMRQIHTEYGWSKEEKLETQKKVIQEMITRAETAGVEIPDADKTTLNNFLKADTHTAISDGLPLTLDNILNKLLEKINEKEAAQA